MIPDRAGTEPRPYGCYAEYAFRLQRVPGEERTERRGNARAIPPPQRRFTYTGSWPTTGNRQSAANGG